MNLDPITVSFFLAMSPILLVLVLSLFLRSRKQSKEGRKDSWFLLGFLFMALFYIMAPDPSGIYLVYTQNGDLRLVLLSGAMSAIALVVAVKVFKRYRSE